MRLEEGNNLYIKLDYQTLDLFLNKICIIMSATCIFRETLECRDSELLLRHRDVPPYATIPVDDDDVYYLMAVVVTRLQPTVDHHYDEVVSRTMQRA
jgi:hypothetical protein